MNTFDLERRIRRDVELGGGGGGRAFEVVRFFEKGA